MTKKQIAATLLAGLFVSAALTTLIPSHAQTRTTVQSASDNHKTIRYRVTVLPDGGTKKADLLQDASDLCRASRRAVEAAETRFYASGAPSISAIKTLIATETADCAALATLRASVRQAKVTLDRSKTAYECAHLRTCPDGGS